MNNYDMSIHHNVSAMAWAKFFKETFPNNELTQDLELMSGWFANAQMAMYDVMAYPAFVSAINARKTLEELIPQLEDVKVNVDLTRTREVIQMINEMEDQFINPMKKLKNKNQEGTDDIPTHILALYDLKNSTYKKEENE